jgi:LemA protein
MLFLVPLVLVFGVALYAVSVYNFLASAKVRIRASISEIGNQLKRQAELIPNLIEATKGYMKHEKDIFEMLSKARQKVDLAIKSGNVSDMVGANDSLVKTIPQLTAVFESNPEIKASEVVKDLMNNLTDTSDKVSYSRRLLIDLSADYNAKLVTIPSSFVASMFGFKEEAGLKMLDAGSSFEVSADEVKTPKVNL